MGDLYVDFKPAEESIKKGSKTFYFAMKFTNPELRNSFYAVYGFCRHTDDLVDNNEDKPDIQRSLITEWKRQFLEAYRKGHSSDSILNAFVHTMKKHNIPLRYPLELINGVSMDIDKKEYKSFPELCRYCYCVASVVGIMLLYAMGVGKLPEARKYAIKLGIAMQLTNILRDVGEDARMGRVYFPKDELARFGLCIKDILSMRRAPPILDFLKFQIARAHRYYEEAKPINNLTVIQKDARRFISLAFTLYREILGVIGENGYDVYHRRAYVNMLRKALLCTHVFVLGVPDTGYQPGNKRMKSD